MPAPKSSVSKLPAVPASGVAALLRAMGLPAVQLSPEVVALRTSVKGTKPAHN